MANKEKDEANDNGVETNKGHKSDMKSTRKSVIKEQYKRRLRRQIWLTNQRGIDVEIENDIISSGLLSVYTISKLVYDLCYKLIYDLFSQYKKNQFQRHKYFVNHLQPI